MFNKQEILQKAKKSILEKKLLNIIYKTKKRQEKARDRYRNLSEEEKNKIKEYQKKEVSRIASVYKRSTKK